MFLKTSGDIKKVQKIMVDADSNFIPFKSSTAFMTSLPDLHAFNVQWFNVIMGLLYYSGIDTALSVENPNSALELVKLCKMLHGDYSRRTHVEAAEKMLSLFDDSISLADMTIDKRIFCCTCTIRYFSPNLK